jgi:sortase A
MRVHAISNWWAMFSRLLDNIEWFLLISGLIAINLYVWLNTSSMVYEAYEDWAFDQDLRHLAPTPLKFTNEEIRALFSRATPQRWNPATKPSLDLKPPTVSPPKSSGTIGRLTIPNLRLLAMVQEGADVETLRYAVGHIPGTALPGARGNVALAGHRDTFFRSLRDIRVNDSIEFETQSVTYRYTVRSTRIVGPRDMQVLAPSGGESLTLVTCYPFYYVGAAPKRFIVSARRVSTVPKQAP